MSYEIVRGDLGPPMPIAVTENGSALDCSTADSVELHWVQPDGTEHTDTLTPVSAVGGTFVMDWVSGDTDQVGPHQGQVVVTIDGVAQTYPADGTNLIWWVNPQVGDTDY